MASTVGTIMALMVFIAFMALITNSYVPAWMMDNERSHMNQVIDQFGQLKNNVDSMTLQQGGSGDYSINMFAPVKLGSEGVPLFATATVGLLSYVPQGTSTSGVNVRFTDPVSGALINSTGGGRADLYVPNRYYVPQWICYENGAIILKQDDGQSIKAKPNLDISKVGGNINVDFTEIDLIGASQSVTGSDAVGFSLDLVYVDSQKYTWGAGSSGTLQLTITTVYGAAWHQYLKDYLSEKKLVGDGVDYDLSPSDSPSASTDRVTTITLTLYKVTEVNYNRAQMEMKMLTT